MLAVISPAKKLDFEIDVPPGALSGAPTGAFSEPEFLDQSELLVATARGLSRDALARTMKLSDKLADLNYRRYRAFSVPFTPANARPAALAFNGDTYVGLDAATLDAGDLAFAQDHLRILSGLYGVLRPLDLIQPYRLEMGARFRPPRGADLYGFWDGRLAEALNDAVRGHADPTIVNLASIEYFKAAQGGDGLKTPVITPVFKEVKSGVAKVLGMFAKRARGAMARHMIKNRLRTPDGLKTFAADGYAYRPDLSDESTWVFTRERARAAA